MTPLDDPLAGAGARFALGRADDAPSGTEKPSPAGVRPWGLRRMGPALTPTASWSAWCFDHERQVAIDHRGVAVLDLAAGPPTAPTTQTVDGEDPPSSEDWINDYVPDEPAQP